MSQRSHRGQRHLLRSRHDPCRGEVGGERLDDGGWNCEVENGSVRSSFDTTINVFEGLLEFERASGGTDESREARASGEEYLLQRSLFRRLSTGEPAAERYLRFTHPNRWRYDVLRGLDYFRSSSLVTGASPDPRLGRLSTTSAPGALRTGPGPSIGT